MSGGLPLGGVVVDDRSAGGDGGSVRCTVTVELVGKVDVMTLMTAVDAANDGSHGVVPHL